MEQVIVGKYKHTKSWQLYELIGLAHHTETLEPLVVYKALYDSKEFWKNAMWVRPQSMFFENIILNGKYVPRFTYLGSVE